MLNQKITFKKRIIAQALFMAFGAVALVNTAQAQALAQTTDSKNADSTLDNSQPVHRVEVTGSNIKRMDAEQASPVTIVTKQEIQQMGANTLQEILAHVSQAVPDLTDSQSMFSATEGASDANLRGLGPEATLVLLNGRRLSNYGTAYGGQYQFVNIDTIPADAIERVEILTDGASAIYGSDAVAGVINVITKKSYVGTEMHASATAVPKTSNNHEYNAGISYGFGDIDQDKFNIYGTLNVFDREAVYQNQILNVLNPTWLSYNPTFIEGFHGNNGSGPGVINPGTQFTYTAAGATIRQPSPGCPTPVMPGTPAQQTPLNTVCALNSLDLGNNWIPSSRRLNLFVNGHYEFNNSLEGFIELSGTMVKLETQLSPPNLYSGGVWSWYARNTGFNLNTFAFPYLSPTNPFNVVANNPALQGNMGGVAGLNYTLLDDPKFSRHTDTDDEYRIVAGLRGTLENKWEWESAVTLAGTHGDLESQGYNPSPAGITAAFGPYSTVNTPSGSYQVISDHPAYQLGVTNASNLALMQQMFPYFSYESWDEIFNWDGKVSGKIGQLGGGDLMFAAGANLNHEYLNSPGATNAANGQIAWQGGSWYEGSRTTEAAYAEIVAPITKRLEIDAAIRDDKYPDFANHIVPKLGVLYKAADSLALRATFSQGFRAPSLAESGTGGIYQQTVVNDPVRCAETNAIITTLSKSPNPQDVQQAQTLQSSSQCTGTVAGGITTPNPQLKPETANIANFGLIFNPVKQFDFSADYWIIDRKNEIVQNNPNTLVANGSATSPGGIPGVFVRGALTPGDLATNNMVATECAANPSLCTGGVPSYQYGNVAGVINSYINQTQSLFDGFDINANAHLDLSGYGKLDFGWKGTIKHRMDSLGNNPAWVGNQVGTYLSPRITGVFSTVWHYQQVDLSLMANYIGPQSILSAFPNGAFSNVAACESNFNTTTALCENGLASSLYWTGNVNWHPTKQVTLNFNIQNLFAHAPQYDPQAWMGINQFEFPYMSGRIYKLTASYKF
ncbi:TonB-dependent receptor domain-containing protein [Solimicrobium silvestre]|uniref:TonB-dependent Receptor Plug Domain n=1 Tax=Solimicrobium silvestre TaxID=2099400 RepID=A0A2S9GXY6_9BURK|nr:TonB-dependent receptor [Solimicrobium silvestre]PRC92571.1 TonB-dependent Receptor Plug Domain [Solimicrobium silvestre]